MGCQKKPKQLCAARADWPTPARCTNVACLLAYGHKGTCSVMPMQIERPTMVIREVWVERWTKDGVVVTCNGVRTPHKQIPFMIANWHDDNPKLLQERNEISLV